MILICLYAFYVSSLSFFFFFCFVLRIRASEIVWGWWYRYGGGWYSKHISDGETCESVRESGRNWRYKSAIRYRNKNCLVFLSLPPHLTPTMHPLPRNTPSNLRTHIHVHTYTYLVLRGFQEGQTKRNKQEKKTKEMCKWKAEMSKMICNYIQGGGVAPKQTKKKETKEKQMNKTNECICKSGNCRPPRSKETKKVLFWSLLHNANPPTHPSPNSPFSYMYISISFQLSLSVFSSLPLNFPTITPFHKKIKQKKKRKILHICDIGTTVLVSLVPPNLLIFPLFLSLSLAVSPRTFSSCLLQDQKGSPL